MTMNECIKKFGSDASRVALCDAGDTLDDANFDEAVANAAIMKLFVLDGWIQTNFTKEPLDFSKDDPSQYTLWDKLLMNEISKALTDAHKSYSEMKHRPIAVMFNHLLAIKESYLIARAGEKNPFIIARYVEALLTIMNPITPHFCQHVWQTLVYPVLSKSTNANKTWNETLLCNGWPENGSVDANLTSQMKYLEGIKREIRLALDKSKAGGKKKGKKGAPAAPETPKESCMIVVGTDFPEY